MTRTANVIGSVSSVLLSFIPLPQLYHTYQKKSADGLSIIYILFQIMANLLFLIYGVLVEDRYIISSNTSLIFLNIVLIFMKYYYQYIGNKKTISIDF